MPSHHQLLAKSGLSFEISSNLNPVDAILKAKDILVGPTNADRLQALGSFVASTSESDRKAVGKSVVGLAENLNKFPIPGLSVERGVAAGNLISSMSNEQAGYVGALTASLTPQQKTIINEMSSVTASSSDRTTSSMKLMGSLNVKQYGIIFKLGTSMSTEQKQDFSVLSGMSLP